MGLQRKEWNMLLKNLRVMIRKTTGNLIFGGVLISYKIKKRTTNLFIVVLFDYIY